MGCADTSASKDRWSLWCQNAGLCNLSAQDPSMRMSDDRLLSLEFDGVQALRAQVPLARVVATCDCGCPTVDVEVDGAAPVSPFSAPTRLVPIEGCVAASNTGAEASGGIILFVDDGRLSCLEYYSMADPPPSKWPTTDEITLVTTG